MENKVVYKIKSQQEFKESIARYLFLLSAMLSVIFILLISYFIFSGGINVFRDVGIKDFLLNSKWAPMNKPASFGIFSMVIGSILVTLISSAMAVPIAVFTASFLACDCPIWLYKILKPALNLMAGIPSIIYGFFALTFIVPKMKDLSGGTGMSILTASVLLLIMILPTIISISENAIRSVPYSYYTGSIALGATHERTIMKVLMPAAKSGIFAGIILGIGRAIGETMAVILVAGNQTRLTFNIFKGIRTLTTNIVMEMGYASGMHREALIATACVLFVFILIINFTFWIFKIRSERI
ncbi:phosphate ABC transporter permease subunit PstC [Peptoniphilus indolicus]|uniref:Phosphate transport system permease protein n=2 Tax=Peptoniphilus indolicus TaxID=33030 RepID=G4D0W3_9FIRM|nr:phosphate ABC transporter permease subunit PstC [Peptoniphilus indolicus]EGY80859.1 phosphate ABC superfamily ATP binding cassette transporter, permease protein [Peptoniphilus indolicus ATCC 29427]SUB74739.1 Phosphate transport system permease protein pstC [Peptoniphilus indolicus]